MQVSTNGGQRFVGVLVCLLILGPVRADADGRLCDNAAREAAISTGVPTEVLRAITRVETGRGSDVQPWPWAVNIGGKGFWFATREAAHSFVFEKFMAGVRNFDVGCFQINYRWHHGAFESIDEMFEPGANARYAARFVSELYDEFGTWSKAAGAYHSRTKRHRDRYIAKFERIRANLDTPAPSTPDMPPEPSPLLTATLAPFFTKGAGRRGAGSLVPLAFRGASADGS